MHSIAINTLSNHIFSVALVVVVDNMSVDIANNNSFAEHIAVLVVQPFDSLVALPIALLVRAVAVVHCNTRIVVAFVDCNIAAVADFDSHAHTQTDCAFRVQTG